MAAASRRLMIRAMSKLLSTMGRSLGSMVPVRKSVTPGISRSGTTIVVGLLLGLDRDLAGRFSFLLSIPAIIGAVVFQFNLDALARVGIVPLIAGFAAAAVVGFFALKVLMGMVRKGHLHYFAPYCWAAGLAAILLSWF